MSRGWFGAACATLPVVATVTALAGCGAVSNAPSLSPEAQRGREVARTNGCAACHGSHGEGGVGPAFAGLYGSPVTLDDGSTMVADAAFLAEKIRDPAANRVAGYEVDMPSNDLDDDQIQAVIAYIRELGDTESSS